MSKDPQRGRGRPKTFCRDQILDTAMRYYWSEGVGSISLNEICRRTNVSKPVMYREFGNEDGLTRAVLVIYYEQVLLQIHQVFKDDRSFDDTLNLLVEAGLEASNEMGYPAGCLYVGMRNVPDQVGALTRDEIAKTQAKIIRTYQDWFERSKARGEFSTRYTTEFAATYLHAQVSNAMNQQARGESTETTKDVLRVALSVLRS